MLEVEKLTVAYDGTEVVHGIDLAVADGEAVALIGSNGAGKTTTLKAVCGWLRATRGSVHIDGVDVTNRPTHRLNRDGVAYVPAERHLFGSMSVAENLQLGAYPARPDKARLHEVFELFPRLADRRSQPAGTMSGGEQQMLAIGRALMAEPSLLLLDEPTTGLAPILAEEVYAVLGRLRTSGALSLVVAEQHVALALDVTNRAYVLEDGHIQLEGTSAELADDDEVRRAYLGMA